MKFEEVLPALREGKKIIFIEGKPKECEHEWEISTIDDNPIWKCNKCYTWKTAGELSEKPKKELPVMHKYPEFGPAKGTSYYYDYRLLWNNVCEILDYLKEKEG